MYTQKNEEQRKKGINYDSSVWIEHRDDNIHLSDISLGSAPILIYPGINWNSAQYYSRVMICNYMDIR